MDIKSQKFLAAVFLITMIRKRDNSQMVLGTTRSPLQEPYLIVMGRQLVQ